MHGIGRYLFQVLVALDQLLNTFAGGWADETLSGRTYRNRHKPGWRRFMQLVDTAFFWQKEHCRIAHKYEQMRYHLPHDFRKDGP